MKRLFSYLLLLSFITISVPRDWVHQCEHDQHIPHADLGDLDSASFDADDCFSCDYSLSSFSIHQFVDHQLIEFHHYGESIRAVNGPVADYSVTISLRGPPQNELS
ncbi:MAG: hypothetical protein ACO2Z9_06395 [Crocinitomicaceae bacterium]